MAGHLRRLAVDALQSADHEGTEDEGDEEFEPAAGLVALTMLPACV